MKSVREVMTISERVHQRDIVLKLSEQPRKPLSISL